MTSPSRGRPQASSREMLADAACELFLEQGYEATTVADITRRAGVSRSSFFNYFDGKAATIWYSLDEQLARFSERAASGEQPIRRVLSCLASDLGETPPHTLALAIINAEIMGIAGQLGIERAVRQAELAARIADSPSIRVTGGSSEGERLRGEILGAASAAAVFSAIWQWAERGTGAIRLDEAIERALAEVPGVAVRGTAAGEEHAAPPSEILRVGIIGAGAIGGQLISAFEAGAIPGATLAGVLTRSSGSLSELLDGSDLIVECAGIAAAREHCPAIIAAGKPLLLVSIGALADPATRASLSSGPGALHLSTGAIGGLDLLRAAARPEGGITRASITSTKRATSLVQAWMSDDEAQSLASARGPIELFIGSVAEAVEKFPGSLNVSCALAAATGLWEATRVRLIADPAAVRTVHEIEATGASGEYRFSIENEVLPENPASSAVVAQAVLSAVEDLTGRRPKFV